jgi:hypothetical protein
MTKYALIIDDIVVNVGVFNEKPSAQGLGVDEVIELGTPNAPIGMLCYREDGVWHTPKLNPVNIILEETLQLENNTEVE